ncbi:hypothetical protein B4134_1272 [Bacillus safensis]|nr:hypothetical protein B4134_1272 [Bacillus safensis]
MPYSIFLTSKGSRKNGIDGYFGAKIENAVKRFQLLHA